MDAKLNQEMANEITSGVQSLKHVPLPQEKIVLPSKQDIQKEKTEKALVEDIQGFDSKALKAVETEEKSCLPTQDDIREEKRRLSQV